MNESDVDALWNRVDENPEDMGLIRVIIDWYWEHDQMDTVEALQWCLLKDRCPERSYFNGNRWKWHVADKSVLPNHIYGKPTVHLWELISHFFPSPNPREEMVMIKSSDLISDIWKQLIFVWPHLSQGQKADLQEWVLTPDNDPIDEQLSTTSSDSELT